jgi:hypothetical protein
MPITGATNKKGLSKEPVFIGGLMKSGTTLLRALLGQHPRLFATFETHWFDDAVRFDWENPNSQRMELLLSLLKIDSAEYRVLCKRKRSESEREFIDIVMEYCCERSGKERWIEKTPDNIRHWGLIQEIWQNPKLIHVTREYKDTYASWKVRRGDSLETFLSAAKNAYDQIRPLLGKATEDYLEVDYLDLVLSTEEAVRRILEHLGEEWDPACAELNLDETGGERKQFKKLLGRESWTFLSLSKPIFTSSIGQWRKLITKEEGRKIEVELEEYYEIFSDRWKNLPEYESSSLLEGR